MARLLQFVHDLIFGYDFFISYAWSDGRTYATRLHQRLTDLGYVVFLDSEDFERGGNWRLGAKSALRRTAKLLVVLTPGACTSDPVAVELKTFSRRKRQIIPINVNGTMEAFGNQRLTKYISHENIFIAETFADLPETPSEQVISEIDKSFNLTKQIKLRFRIATVAVVILSFMTLASATAAYYANIRTIEANEQRAIAEEQAHRSARGLFAANLRIGRSHEDPNRFPFEYRSLPFMVQIEAQRHSTDDVGSEEYEGVVTSLLVETVVYDGNDPAVAIASHPRSKAHAVATRRGEILYWSAANFQKPLSLGLAKDIAFLGFGDNAQILFALSSAGALHEFHVDKHGVQSTRLLTDGNSASHFVLSPIGGWVAVQGDGLKLARGLDEIVAPPPEFDMIVRCVANDGSHAILWKDGSDGYSIYDVRTGTYRNVDTPQLLATSCGIGENKKFFVQGDFGAHVYDYGSGDGAERLSTIPEEYEPTLVFDENGDILYSLEAGYGGVFSAYDVYSGEQLSELGLQEETPPFLSARSTPRGFLVLTQTGMVVELLASQGPGYARLGRNEDFMDRVLLSPSGEYVASIDISGYLFIWRTLDGKLLNKIEAVRGPIVFSEETGHVIGTEYFEGPNRLKAWRIDGGVSAEVAVEISVQPESMFSCGVKQRTIGITKGDKLRLYDFDDRGFEPGLETDLPFEGMVKVSRDCSVAVLIAQAKEPVFLDLKSGDVRTDLSTDVQVGSDSFASLSVDGSELAFFDAEDHLRLFRVFPDSVQATARVELPNGGGPVGHAGSAGRLAVQSDQRGQAYIQLVEIDPEPRYSKPFHTVQINRIGEEFFSVGNDSIAVGAQGVFDGTFYTINVDLLSIPAMTAVGQIFTPNGQKYE